MLQLIARAWDYRSQSEPTTPPVSIKMLSRRKIIPNIHAPPPLFGESGDMRERANVKSQAIPRAATLTSRVRLGKSVNAHCRIPDGHTSTQLYLVAG